MQRHALASFVYRDALSVVHGTLDQIQSSMEELDEELNSRFHLPQPPVGLINSTKSSTIGHTRDHT